MWKNPETQKQILGTCIMVTLICVIFIVSRILHIEIHEVKAFLLKYPLWLNGIFYVALYVGATSMIFVGPKDIIRVLGAVFYGGPVSTLLVYIAELINSFILFHVSRKLGRDMILNKWEKHRQKMGRAQDHTTFLGIMALRINLIFPFRILDMGYGLTHVSYWKYLAVAVVASPLRLFLIQDILAKLGETFLTQPFASAFRLVNDPFFQKMAMVYVGVVLAVTLVAIIEKVVLRIQAKRRAEFSNGGKA